MGMLMHRHYLEKIGATKEVAPEKVVVEEKKVEESPKKETKSTKK